MKIIIGDALVIVLSSLVLGLLLGQIGQADRYPAWLVAAAVILGSACGLTLVFSGFRPR